MYEIVKDIAAIAAMAMSKMMINRLRDRITPSQFQLHIWPPIHYEPSSRNLGHV
jgi:hypothetical protein